MALVDTGIQSIAAVLGGSGAIPSYIAIGTGSSTVSGNMLALDTETDRNALTSIDLSVAKDVTYIADYSATELSGTTLTEFGLFNASSAGSMYMREVIGSIAFQGDIELQLQCSLRFSKSGT